MNLTRGTLVTALRSLDPRGANVHPGTLGVVYEEYGFHEPGTGPMVRWFTGTACNVYEGDVAETDCPPEEADRTNTWVLRFCDLVGQDGSTENGRLEAFAMLHDLSRGKQVIRWFNDICGPSALVGQYALLITEATHDEWNWAVVHRAGRGPSRTGSTNSCYEAKAAAEQALKEMR